MQEGGAEQPWHERGVLDRVPGPPAAPAEHVIGPPAAHRDADRQPAPRRQRPGPHPARPDGVDPALDQRRDREGIGDRKPDIAEIEKRRMEGEPRVLEQRVEVAAVGGHRKQPRERVRGRDDEQQRAKPEEPLDRQRTGAQARRQGPAEKRDEAAEQRQHEDPQHHRAFVAAPGAGDLVEHRLCQARILEDVEHREVGHDVGADEDREGERHQPQLQDRRRPRHIHQRPALRRRPDERHRPLHRRHEQRQHEREMADLYEHVNAPQARSAFRTILAQSAFSRYVLPLTN